MPTLIFNYSDYCVKDNERWNNKKSVREFNYLNDVIEAIQNIEKNIFF